MHRTQPFLTRCFLEGRRSSKIAAVTVSGGDQGGQENLSGDGSTRPSSGCSIMFVETGTGKSFTTTAMMMAAGATGRSRATMAAALELTHQVLGWAAEPRPADVWNAQLANKFEQLAEVREYWRSLAAIKIPDLGVNEVPAPALQRDALWLHDLDHHSSLEWTVYSGSAPSEPWDQGFSPMATVYGAYLGGLSRDLRRILDPLIGPLASQGATIWVILGALLKIIGRLCSSYDVGGPEPDRPPGQRVTSQPHITRGPTSSRAVSVLSVLRRPVFV
jgi:hypothetical protein